MFELLCKGIDMTRRNSATGEVVKLVVKYIGVTQQSKPNSQIPLKKIFLRYPISTHTFPTLHLYEHELYAAGLKPNLKTVANN